MFSMCRFFPYTAVDNTGKPDISNSIKFLTPATGQEELTSISIELSQEKSTKTKRADNRVKRDEVLVGLNGKITAYGIDFDALAAITNSFVKDATASAFDFVAPASGNPRGVFYYHAKTGDGKKYNVWLYDVEFETPNLPAEQESEEPQTIELNFFAAKFKYGTKVVIGRFVPEGATGYLEDGVEPTASNLPAPAATTGV